MSNYNWERGPNWFERNFRRLAIAAVFMALVASVWFMRAASSAVFVSPPT